MKLTQVVRQRIRHESMGEVGRRLGHGYVVWLTPEDMDALEAIAQERFTKPESMKVQDFLHYIVRKFIEERKQEIQQTQGG